MATPTIAKNTRRGVDAMFCRDNSDNVLGALAIIFHEDITDPASLEALSCREALALVGSCAETATYSTRL
jgi:hypothetical protein